MIIITIITIVIIIIIIIDSFQNELSKNAGFNKYCY